MNYSLLSLTYIIKEDKIVSDTASIEALYTYNDVYKCSHNDIPNAITNFLEKTSEKYKNNAHINFLNLELVKNIKNYEGFRNFIENMNNITNDFLECDTEFEYELYDDIDITHIDYSCDNIYWKLIKYLKSPNVGTDTSYKIHLHISYKNINKLINITPFNMYSQITNINAVITYFDINNRPITIETIYIVAPCYEHISRKQLLLTIVRNLKKELLLKYRDCLFQLLVHKNNKLLIEEGDDNYTNVFGNTQIIKSINNTCYKYTTKKFIPKQVNNISVFTIIDKICNTQTQKNFASDCLILVQ